jgi:hypothetical protein
MHEPHTSSFGKLGVQRQYLDREGNFVYHTLAGRLFFCPQFKIVWRVVEAVTVFVMNVFVLFERAPENLSHRLSVLVGFLASPKMQPPISRRMNVAFFVYRTPLTTFPAAFLRAKAGFSVVAEKLPLFGAKAVVFFDFSAARAREVCRFLAHGWTYTALEPYVKEIV